ncbi:retrovirus-related pol polyprotein from transposon TNT 1-94 [Tanacetum coccineum]
MTAGQKKPEGQWIGDERKVANLDQRLKSLIMSVLPDDQMNSVINCLTAKSTWDDLILYHEGPSDVKESRVMDLMLCYNTFKFKEGETLTQTFTIYKALMNENTNHVKDSELASLFGLFKYEENPIDSIYETEKNKSLVSATPLSTAFISTSIVHDFQDSPDNEEDTRSSHEYLNDLEEEYQVRALLSKSKRVFKKGTQSSSQQKPELRPTKDFEAKYNKVKAKLALLSSSASAFKAATIKNKAEENDAVSKEGTKNNEWVKISMRKYDIRKPIWYLDSGCSRHMTDVKSYLHKYMEQLGPKVVFGDDSTCVTEGYGSIKCNGIVFTKLAFVNGLKYNLINISQLCDAKYIVQFDEKRGTIFNSNKEIVMIALKVRDVYVLDMTSSAQESCFFVKASENLNWLWHKRLAHLNFKTINKLAKQNLVIGLPSLVYSKDKPCSSCEKGKHHMASFKTKQTSSIKKCLHLLHIDLFGPITPRSINHEKYTLVIVDEYSRYTWVYFLKKKSQAPKTIMSFINRVENQNDIKVKQLRTDNGTKFRNSILVNFYDEKGISQNFSSPYTPEQNGVAERKNRTLIEAARTMLSGSVFSKQYWTEAVATACYTQNRFTIFDEKADDGYLLGYSLVSNAFRVFNTRRQKTKEIYHITFDESTDAIKFSKPSVDNINIAENERYPPDEYLHPYEPSQRYQTNNNDVSFIEPYECPEPVVLETKVSSDQNGLTDQNDQSVQNDEILNDDHSEHSNHTNDVQIIDNLPNTKDFQISKYSSSPRVEDTSVQDIIPILNPPLPIPSVVTPAPQDRWSQDKHIKLVNIIGNPEARMLTRAMAKELGAASAHECLFVDFLFEEEPRKVSEALQHPGWVDAIQDELNQFTRNKVWTLVPAPYGKTIIGSKWVFMNKRDETGIVIKNKARLVAQGYNKNEGIDYDETLIQLQDLKQSESFLPLPHT